MTKFQLRRAAAIFAIITSPWWAGLLMSFLNKPEELSGLAIIFAVIYGIPVIAAVGLIFSFIFRHRTNAAKLTLFSYLIPALLVVSWEIAALYS